MGALALEHLNSFRDHPDSNPNYTCRFEKVDVTIEEAVNAAVERTDRVFDGVNILLCFAGITGSDAAVDYPIAEWRRIMDVNVQGSFLVARAFAR